MSTVANSGLPDTFLPKMLIHYRFFSLCCESCRMSIVRSFALTLAVGALVAPVSVHALKLSDVPVPRERPSDAANETPDAPESAGAESAGAESGGAAVDATAANAAAAAELPAMSSNGIPLPRLRPVNAADAADWDAVDGVVVEAAANVAADVAAVELPALSVNGIPFPRVRPEYTAVRRTANTPAGFEAPVVDKATAAAVKEALGHLSAKRYDAALAIQKRLSDPAARKLIEFAYVRDYSYAAPYSRIAAFLAENPDWPDIGLIRKRFEVALLAQKAKPEAVLAAFAETPPTSSAGVIVYAAALTATGSGERANELVRALWRNGSLTEGEEKLVIDKFSAALSEEDHKERMDQLLYNSETSAAMRAAKRVGGDAVKLAEARIAVVRRSKSAGSMLDKLPAGLKEDPGYLLSRVQLQRRADKDAEAAKLLLGADYEPRELIDPDEWALEGRIVARELMELGDATQAYSIVSRHASESAIERLENEWYAGWVALRQLKDPEAARRHFRELLNIATTPISTARAEYWTGRAEEAAGNLEEALGHYIAAGRHSTTYYGQLALDRIGQENVPGPRKPVFADTARRIVGARDSMRAMRILDQIGMRDQAARYMISMANESVDPLTLVGIAETAQQMGLKYAVVWIGKRGTQAGAPTEAYAFATDTMPDYPNVGPSIEKAVVYAVARQESVFNPAAISPAGARGLMQMMPATAKATAKAFGQIYDVNRLTSDARYNATLGAAHLGELADQFDNAFALVFAAYNAGPSRVYEWIKRFGDPRKGEIDPVDWVEMIPFSETRNYVQRVMEGLQVYRASLSGDHRLLIADDLKLPSNVGHALAAVESATGNSGNNGVPGVFSGFSDGPVDTGGAPPSALGFGGGL